MDQFEYIMVLVSIIVGLGIAHILLGVGQIIDRVASVKSPIRFSLAYFAWLAYIFNWLVLFWWWEFRFGEFVVEWSIGLYLFLVLYAVLLFLLASVLVPRSWDPVEDLGTFLVQRRFWFYSLFLAASAVDVADTVLKGGSDRLASLLVGPTGLLVATSFLAGVIGLLSLKPRTHAITGFAMLAVQVLAALKDLPVLGF